MIVQLNCDAFPLASDDAVPQVREPEEAEAGLLVSLDALRHTLLRDHLEGLREAGAGLFQDSKTGTGLHPDDMDAYDKLRIGKEMIFDAIDSDLGLEGLDPIALRLISRIRHTGLHWPMMRTCTGVTPNNAYGHANVTCSVDADCPLSYQGRCNGLTVQTFEGEPTTFDDTVAALKAWYNEKIAAGTTVASELNLRVTAANNLVRARRCRGVWHPGEPGKDGACVV